MKHFAANHIRVLKVDDQQISPLELAARGLRMAWCVIRHIVPKSVLKVQCGAIGACDGTDRLEVDATISTSEKKTTQPGRALIY